MTKHIPVYIGNEAISELVKFCKENSLDKFVLVSDKNTYSVLGKSVEAALKAENFDLITIILEGKEVIADSHHILEVFLRTDRENRIFLAVGSGTITDITRFVSHRSRNVFISVPTAPSVDGFNSIGAPLVVGNMKKTYICHGPIAVFANLSIISNAPNLLIASGFSDLLGKLPSIADWKLGHLLWDEPYDSSIDHRMRKAVREVTDLAEKIGNKDLESIRLLMEGLIESGFCMLDFGNSSPASGAEHHISHYWEMMLLKQHRPAIFHGVKVGIASIESAAWYSRIKKTSISEVENLLRQASPPDFEAEQKKIIAKFGSDLAPVIIRDQKAFISMTAPVLDKLKERVVNRWDKIQEIARQVPEPDVFTKWLSLAGAPTTGEQIGFSSEEVADGLNYGHYLRNRFTINKLRLLFKWD